MASRAESHAPRSTNRDAAGRHGGTQGDLFSSVSQSPRSFLDGVHRAPTWVLGPLALSRSAFLRAGGPRVPLGTDSLPLCERTHRVSLMGYPR